MALAQRVALWEEASEGQDPCGVRGGDDLDGLRTPPAASLRWNGRETPAWCPKPRSAPASFMSQLLVSLVLNRTLLFVEVFGPPLIHLVPRAGGWNLLFQI